MDPDRKNDFLARLQFRRKDELERIAIDTKDYIQWYQDKFEVISELLLEKGEND